MVSPVEHSLVNTCLLQKIMCKLDMYRMYQLQLHKRFYIQYAFLSHVLNISHAGPFCVVTRDQRLLWFCHEQTKLILCYFCLLYRLWPVHKLEELKAKSITCGCEATMFTRTFSTLLLLPHSLYGGNQKMQKIRMLLLDALLAISH